MTTPLIVAALGMAVLGVLSYIVVKLSGGPTPPPRTKTPLDGRQRPYDRMPDGGWQ